MPAGRRQHGLAPGGIRGALLAWLDEELRLCRQGDANMGAGRVGKGGSCWRGPTEDKGFAGRATPTWAPAARQNPGLVGVPRRRIKALRAGRRQHGCRQRGKGRALLAWLDGKQRLCRQGDANMGAGNAGKGGPCWRRRGKGRALLAWPDGRQRLCRQGDANMGAGNQSSQKGRFLRPIRKKRAKPPHMNCDCFALYLLNCPAGPTYRICLPSLPRRS